MLGHKITVFDRNNYNETRYEPGEDRQQQVASIDPNKIVSQHDQVSLTTRSPC